MLSGGFAVHHHGVLTNTRPNGAAPAFHDARSVATLLRQRGYLTAFVGKYMNLYPAILGITSKGGPIAPGHYVPPGWSAFVTYAADRLDWNDYPFVTGTAGVAGPESGLLLPIEVSTRASRLAEMVDLGLPAPVAMYVNGLDLADLPHASDHEREVALRVLEAAENDPQHPFFLLVSSVIPHGPATPTASDKGLFLGYQYRDRAWGEVDMTDKPEHLDRVADQFWSLINGDEKFAVGGRRDPDTFFADQLRSLQGLDRTVDAIMQRIEASPVTFCTRKCFT